MGRQKQSLSNFNQSLNDHLWSIHQNIRKSRPEIDRISFALYDHKSGHLKTYADSTPHGEILAHYDYPLNKLPSLQACAEQRTTRHLSHIPQLLRVDSEHNHWLREQGFGSSLATPAYCDDEFIGFIFLNSYADDAFNSEVQSELQPYLDSIRQLAANEYDIIHTILDAIEFYLERTPKMHNQIRDHHQRMFHFTKVIAHGVADHYRISDEDIEIITQFSRFHDIGKLSLPPKLLLKPDSLAAMERVQISDHIAKGITIVDQIIKDSGKASHPCLNILKSIISHHQEMLDGSGYPLGLCGDDIPVASRIITVANIFDALTTHRPYKQARSVPFALLELEKMVQSNKIDKQCVNALRDKQDFLKSIIDAYPEQDPKDRYI